MNREEYVERMRGARQFARFGITPEWLPGEGDIDGFVHDEVVRQWHDPRVAYDGGERVTWMGMAWKYAQAVQGTVGHIDPTAEDILTIGSLVEQKENSRGFRQVGVWIGNRAGAPWECIPEFVDRLVDMLPIAPEQYRIGLHANQMSPETFNEDVRRVRTADDWYLAYEWIHPFGDGNGRSGKVLHNWLMFALDDPVLVADYFGGGNP